MINANLKNSLKLFYFDSFIADANKVVTTVKPDYICVPGLFRIYKNFFVLYEKKISFLFAEIFLAIPFILVKVDFDKKIVKYFISPNLAGFFIYIFTGSFCLGSFFFFVYSLFLDNYGIFGSAGIFFVFLISLFIFMINPVSSKYYNQIISNMLNSLNVYIANEQH